jgi:hypothetical protein
MPTARCESCKSSFETEDASAVCPLCGQPAEIDLTIRVLCSCGTTLKAPPKMRGRVITCPRCTRPVPIPRGNEAEEARSTVQVGRQTRWVFAVALIPLFIAMQGGRDDARARVDRTLSNLKIDAADERSLAGKVDRIPGKRAERAAMSQDSGMPYAYGFAGFAAILLFVLLSFGTPTLGSRNLALGTIGGLLAGSAVGIVVNLALPPPAGEDGAGRLLGAAILGGAAAEILKATWLVILRGKLPTRALILLGLAIGAGVGAGQALQYASSAMAGIALARAFWSEFITIIALQAVWGGIIALFLARAGKSQAALFARILSAAGAAIGLHVAFEFFHRQELILGSIVVGLASFALFHALHYWTEETQQEVVAGETIRV